MSESELFHLPAEVREGLALARARDRKSTGGRLRVQMGEAWYPIITFDETGFEVPLTAFADAPHLRGLVEIHDGPRMIRTVLVVAGEPSGDTMRYDFKRTTAPRMQAPVDYERTTEAPVAYLTGR
ncbi:hypothetical protein [Jannaschia donghaensis]|uniref:Uncharacterized protein n=1 Tax=Jannaschia donghaensis TaxID=420998 RepID=A0A0M6YEZ3_9RHOB|nr:hypothetical protein [Jannaschia donghaensis]CTQ48329.1 hypothetical protein JDO7802_00331 [Jannaschia donghaensis]